MKIEEKNRNTEHKFARQGAVATQRASSKIGHAKQTSNRKRAEEIVLEKKLDYALLSLLVK